MAPKNAMKAAAMKPMKAAAMKVVKPKAKAKGKAVKDYVVKMVKGKKALIHKTSQII